MAAVTDFSDFGAQEKKSVTASTFSSSFCHEVTWPWSWSFWCWYSSQLFHSPLSTSWRGSLVLHFLPLGWCHLHMWMKNSYIHIFLSTLLYENTYLSSSYNHSLKFHFLCFDEIIRPFFNLRSVFMLVTLGFRLWISLRDTYLFLMIVRECHRTMYPIFHHTQLNILLNILPKSSILTVS